MFKYGLTLVCMVSHHIAIQILYTRFLQGFFVPSVKLNDAMIRRLPVPESGQVLYRDTQLSGLVVRVMPTSKRSFVVDKWNAGKVTRITLGGVRSVKRLLTHSVNYNDVTSGYIVTDVGRLRLPMQQIEDFILAAAGEVKTDKATKRQFKDKPVGKLSKGKPSVKVGARQAGR